MRQPSGAALWPPADHALPPRAPFELLFLDGGGFKQAPFEAGPLAIDLLGPAGLLVIDDRRTAAIVAACRDRR